MKSRSIIYESSSCWVTWEAYFLAICNGLVSSFQLNQHRCSKKYENFFLHWKKQAIFRKVVSKNIYSSLKFLGNIITRTPVSATQHFPEHWVLALCGYDPSLFWTTTVSRLHTLLSTCLSHSADICVSARHCSRHGRYSWSKQSERPDFLAFPCQQEPTEKETK